MEKTMDIKKLQEQSITRKIVRDWEDCTDAFRKGYLLYESGFANKDPEQQERAVKGFTRYCEAIAGVKLPHKKIKYIIYQSKQAKGHRMKINKFGMNFGKRIRNPEKEMGGLHVK